MQKRLLDTDHRKDWIIFTISISSVVVIVILGVLAGLLINYNRIIDAELLTRAQSHFENILLTRRWNATHGGVFVEKTEGMQSNPYLINPDITTIDGKIYTKKNPALMTREISEIAERDGIFQFHITSLNPLNPSNAPDAFETKALTDFAEGVTEATTLESDDGDTFFRYMGPLLTEESCLQCHGVQGYRKGDIRGGISVRFSISDVKVSVRRINLIVAGIFAVIALFSVAILYLFVSKMSKKLSTALLEIKELASRDSLTGLFNRRFLMDWLETELSRCVRYQIDISCLLIDIDFFKKINDTYGHQVGDLVLQRISKLLARNIRNSDIVSRYGGEEFLIVLANTGHDGAICAAEKILRVIREEQIPQGNGQDIQITVSIGVASVRGDEISDKTTIDQIIMIADKNLYIAKAEGRNRIAFAT